MFNELAIYGLMSTKNKETLQYYISFYGLLLLRAPSGGWRGIATFNEATASAGEAAHTHHVPSTRTTKARRSNTNSYDD